MELSKNDLDMLHGGLAKKPLLFTLPIALSSMMQQLFSAADTAVVGLFGRPGALAAVGTNTEIVALIVTVSSGLSIGANVLIANRIGKNQTDDLPAALRSVLALALVIGGLGAALGQLDRCRKILWLCLGFSVLGSLVMIVPAVVFRDFFCGLFSGDPAEIECACVRILCILFFEPVCSLYEIPAGVLRGTGRAVLPAADMMVGTCAFRIVWIMMVFRAHPSPEALFHAFPLSWLATIALVALTFALCRPLKPRAEA